MAVIDPKDDCVVIRVVYDGAPMAGKTTSVATLGQRLGAGVYSPANLDGRTLYFDWLDYTGGLFEGRRIRCQIISVPGQATLAPRRRRLLESADVVVFVGDSSPDGFEADRRYLAGLRGVLSEIDGPPVGLVLQANKRDLTNAIPIDRLRELLDQLELRSAIIESVATEGAGVRETFVFAVRLALDRVRELMRNGALTTTAPKINSAQDLLREMQDAEDGSLDFATESGSLKHTRLHDLHQTTSVAAQAFQEAMRDNVDAPALEPAPALEQVITNEHTPTVPDDKVASGLVWPPVDGRMILHETKAATTSLQRADNGDWIGDVDSRWWLHSAADAVYDNVDAGRAELVQWARLHTNHPGLLSHQRCIVLAADGRDQFRLWQIVRREPTLRSQIAAVLNDEASVMVATLLSAAHAFLQMAERLSSAECELQLSLDTIGSSATGPIYVGFIPQPSLIRPAQSLSRSQASELLFAELGFVQPTFRARRSELFTELAKIAGNPQSSSQSEWRLLQRLLALARD